MFKRKNRDFLSYLVVMTTGELYEFADRGALVKFCDSLDHGSYRVFGCLLEVHGGDVYASL